MCLNVSWLHAFSPSRAVGNLDAQSMNCGMGYVNNYFRDHFAVSSPGCEVAVHARLGPELAVACVRALLRAWRLGSLTPPPPRSTQQGVPTQLYGEGELCGVCVRRGCTDAASENALGEPPG